MNRKFAEGLPSGGRRLLLIRTKHNDRPSVEEEIYDRSGFMVRSIGDQKSFVEEHEITGHVRCGS
jgi:hypothetical protein